MLSQSAAPQVLGALGSLTGVPVVQAVAGTAAVILEAANVRVLVVAWSMRLKVGLIL